MPDQIHHAGEQHAEDNRPEYDDARDAQGTEQHVTQSAHVAGRVDDLDDDGVVDWLSH